MEGRARCRAGPVAGAGQIAVGLIYAWCGNAHGASALLRRGGQRVSGYAGAAPHGIDAAAISLAASELATRIDTGGLAAIETDLLTVRMAPGGR